MSEFNGVSEVTNIMSGIVIRCGCTLEQRIEKNWHGYMNEVCPNPKEIEDLGILARKHRNPLINMWWKIVDYYNR